MRRLLVAISLNVALLLVAAADSTAQTYPAGPYPGDGGHYVSRPYYRWRHGYYRNPYDYYRDLYPKYYHGRMHARHLYNLGFPSGEVHLRGTPW